MQRTSQPALDLVRRARRHEMAAIISVTEAALAEFREKFPPAIFQAYVEETTRIADRWDDAEVLVAEVDGAIAGTVSFYPDAGKEGFPSGWAGFRTLAVHPSARGLGVGKALMRTCFDRARRRGALAIGIHTAPVMTAARRMYEDAGFVRSPEHDFRASEALKLGEGAGEMVVLGYRLDMTA